MPRVRLHALQWGPFSVGPPPPRGGRGRRSSPPPPWAFPSSSFSSGTAPPPPSPPRASSGPGLGISRRRPGVPKVPATPAGGSPYPGIPPPPKLPVGVGGNVEVGGAAPSAALRHLLLLRSGGASAAQSPGLLQLGGAALGANPLRTRGSLPALAPALVLRGVLAPPVGRRAGGPLGLLEEGAGAGPGEGEGEGEGGVAAVPQVRGLVRRPRGRVD